MDGERITFLFSARVPRGRFGSGSAADLTSECDGREISVFYTVSVTSNLDEMCSVEC